MMPVTNIIFIPNLNKFNWWEICSSLISNGNPDPAVTNMVNERAEMFVKIMDAPLTTDNLIQRDIGNGTYFLMLRQLNFSVQKT